ncbi:hypothetical protein AAFF_G00025410 [Aldrovandia affinis]|uniref:FBX41/ZN365 C2H2-type zinc finger domain-containing protein n=1 Tax=Aldrovandia affinis TaxID=143900 RepID=A0AAD7S4Z3_9TELE|nr:hypothetical protein AAFF_G00025410 [Aldrovandia affinis]
MQDNVKDLCDMQKEPNDRKAPLCIDLGQPCGVALLQLAFRCPRCGEHQRFRSLASLRPHLDYSHLYHTVDDLSPVSSCDTGDALLNHKKPRDAGCTGNGGSSPVKKPEPVDSMGRREGFKSKATADPSHPQGPAACREATGKRRPEENLRVVDSPVERRLQEVSMELLQKEAELLHVHAHSRHLVLAKQEVLERERTLCRQVDTAVMVIGSLREHLQESERELERKKREVITIHNFLEVAAQQEMCGKVRLRHFIENLLRRIALAEMLLEYYQSGSGQPNCRNHTTFHEYENGYYGSTESWSSGGPYASAVYPETRGLSAQKVRRLSKSAKERRRSWESSSHSDQVRETWELCRTSEGYEDSK